MKTLLATIATITLTTYIAKADLITFEDLPAPSQPYPNEIIAYEVLPTVYNGFSWTTQLNSPYFGNGWGYYNMKEWDMGGYDNGIIDNRALYSPYGGGYAAGYLISNTAYWMFTSAYFTSAWENQGGVALHIDGYIGDQAVFTHTATIYRSHKTLVVPPQLIIDRVHIWGGYASSAGDHWIMDDMSYGLVPAPSAIALLGLVGLGGRRRRGEKP